MFFARLFTKNMIKHKKNVTKLNILFIIDARRKHFFFIFADGKQNCK